MDKTQIINTIIDFIDAPYDERPSDFDDIQPITLAQASEYLEDYRLDAHECDDADAVAAFAEATPEILVEAWDKYCAGKRYELILDNLSDYITENECVCEYDQFCADYQKNPPRALPVEFLDCSSIEAFPFHVARQLSVADLVQIGINSANSNLNHVYVYFNEDTMVLNSTDTPFEDGILDARGFAEFLLGNADALKQFLNSVDTDEVVEVFGCSHDEIEKRVRTVYAITFMHNTDNPWDETIECSTTDEVADLIESKLADERTLVCDFQKKEVAVW